MFLWSCTTTYYKLLEITPNNVKLCNVQIFIDFDTVNYFHLFLYLFLFLHVGHATLILFTEVKKKKVLSEDAFSNELALASVLNGV